MAKIRDDQHEALRDALVSAYPGLQDLRELAEFGIGINLDEHVDVEGGTARVTWRLIKWLQARGPVDPLFVAALERRPRNEQLAAFARRIGHATVRGREAALQKSSFDLEDLEGHCKALIEGQLHRGLRVLILSGAEQQVFDCLTERLRPVVHRSPNGTPPDCEVPLDPRLANIDREIGRVKRLFDKVTQRHVLVKVHAAEASSAALTVFVGAVRAGVPAKLAHDFVLLIRAAAELDPPLAPGLAEMLPRPAFDGTHLYRWVERASDGQGWNETLKTEFKLALRALARLEQAPSTGDFYDAVTEAIECLRANPDEATLREWIAEQLARYPSTGVLT